MILVGVLCFAGAFAYENYTGRSVVSAVKSFSFGGAGGGFAGGYGMAVDSGRSIGSSVGGLGAGVGAAMGSIGK